MRKLIVLFVFFTLIVSLGIVVSAQDDDTSLCFDGTWNCPDPNDSAREEWNWGCGWYRGMFNAGRIDGVPEWCGNTTDTDGDGVVDVLDECPLEVGPVDNAGCPAVVDGGTPPAPPATGCYDTKPGYVDMQYFGPIDTPGNVHFFGTDDGTCVGVFLTTAMFVQTNLTLSSDVLNLCNRIGSGFILARGMQAFYIPTPSIAADIWICF
jgi:hypothetical protein